MSPRSLRILSGDCAGRMARDSATASSYQLAPTKTTIYSMRTSCERNWVFSRVRMTP